MWQLSVKKAIGRMFNVGHLWALAKTVVARTKNNSAAICALFFFFSENQILSCYPYLIAGEYIS